MRKACVLVVVLVALALAAENWIGYTEPKLSALPRNSENPLFQLLPPAGPNDRPNIDTVKYDDNAAANAWAMYRAGGGFGVKFIKPANPINLAGAQINLWAATWPSPGSNRFQVKVLAANGPNGTPGDSLFLSGVITGTRGAWNYVPIGVPIIDDEFYIFYIQPDSYPMCPGMSIDRYSNAPDGREWEVAGGAFAPASAIGDWLIRAIIDWTPQTNNVAAMYYSGMPRETVPGVNFALQSTFRNFGTQTQNPGIRVKMQITGPLGYVRDFLTDSTAGTMPYRGQQVVTFHPNWRTPDTAGTYFLKVWHELPTDEYRANDTMVKSISVARWITYADWNTPTWVTWAGADRATLFHPPDFGLGYPVEVSRVKSQFYWYSGHAWEDSIFHFAIIGDDGSTILWESDTLRAAHQATVGASVAPPVVISTGDFYVGVMPRGSLGNPSNLSDGTYDGQSYFGSPGSWAPYTSGELFIAASAKTSVTALEEATSVYGRAAVSVGAAPNPSRQPTVHWQIARPGPLTVDLYDAAGRRIRTIYSLRTSQALAGSFRFDSRDLPSGLYLLRLASAGARATAKFVKD